MGEKRERGEEKEGGRGTPEEREGEKEGGGRGDRGKAEGGETEDRVRRLVKREKERGGAKGKRRGGSRVKGRGAGNAAASQLPGVKVE